MTDGGRDCDVLFGEFLEMDNRAVKLLGEFYAWLQNDEGLTPQAASPLAHEADRYLRDFMVEILELLPEDADGATMRAYISNWFIINTPTVSHEELDRVAGALGLLYKFMGTTGVIGAEVAGETTKVLASPKFCHERLERFWTMGADEIPGWRDEHDYRKFCKSSVTLQ